MYKGEISIQTKKTTHKVENKYGNDALNLLYDDLWRTALMEDYQATEGKNKRTRETARIKAQTIRWVYGLMQRIADELEEETEEEKKARQQTADKEMFDTMFQKTM